MIFEKQKKKKWYKQEIFSCGKYIKPVKVQYRCANSTRDGILLHIYVKERRLCIMKLFMFSKECRSYARIPFEI